MGGWMDGWKIGRKVRDYVGRDGNTTSAVESFWMVRVMHAGALDGFRNYHVYIPTYIEGRGYIHPP